MGSAFSPSNRYEFLASVWLQQQDLSDKTPVEIAELYFDALRQICKKYSKPSPKNQRPRVISPGIDSDSW